MFASVCHQHSCVSNSLVTGMPPVGDSPLMFLFQPATLLLCCRFPAPLCLPPHHHISKPPSVACINRVILAPGRCFADHRMQALSDTAFFPQHRLSPYVRFWVALELLACLAAHSVRY